MTQARGLRSGEQEIDMSSHAPSRAGGRFDWSRINQWLLWIGLAATVAWLFYGHGEHLLRLSPFLILLACPLMHVFGHGGHGRHGGHSSHQRDEPLDRSERQEKPEQRGGSGHVH
jgi:hypothetical protein